MAARLNRISTHVLDLARGKPAQGVAVRFERHDENLGWKALRTARTDHDGRCNQLLHDGDECPAGVYRLVFETGVYYGAQEIQTLYPTVEITFHVRPGETHFHIPLLLNANGYTTYRGT
jgi:5-hydroxyisourate hydrolase